MKKGRKAVFAKNANTVNLGSEPPQPPSETLPETVPESSRSLRPEASQDRYSANGDDDLTYISSRQLEEVVSMLQSSTSGSLKRQISYIDEDGEDVSVGLYSNIGTCEELTAMVTVRVPY